MTVKAVMLALAAAALVAGMSAPADAGPAACTLAVATCTSEWNQAEASSFCSSPTITVDTSSCECELDGSCSITANVTSVEGGSVTVTSTTWTPSMDLSLEEHKVDGIDICFKKKSDNTAFTARVRAPCASNEIDSKGAGDGDLCLQTCPGKR